MVAIVVELFEEERSVEFACRDAAMGRDLYLHVVAPAKLGEHEPVVDELAPNFLQGSDAPATSFAVAAGLVM